MIVFHVSEEPDIEVFEPRKFEATGELFVWAIDDERLCNYLVPRDCPRVTFYAGPHTTDADRERFLGASRAVSLSRRVVRAKAVMSVVLLPPPRRDRMSQDCRNFVSRTAVKPMSVTIVEDPLAAVLQRESSCESCRAYGRFEAPSSNRHWSFPSFGGAMHCRNRRLKTAYSRRRRCDQTRRG